MQRHVADHLGRRRNLDDVAEHDVDVRIGLRDLRPSRFQAKGTGLLAQVRVLAARHFMVIYV
jgi:hypothetical protein